LGIDEIGPISPHTLPGNLESQIFQDSSRLFQRLYPSKIKVQENSKIKKKVKEFKQKINTEKFTKNG